MTFHDVSHGNKYTLLGQDNFKCARKAVLDFLQTAKILLSEFQLCDYDETNPVHVLTDGLARVSVRPFGVVLRHRRNSSRLSHLVLATQ